MMWIKSGAVAVAALAFAVSLGAGNAKAEVEYPWCAAYTGPARGVVTCGYVSWQQCMATVHGVGGFCQMNPRFIAAPDEPRRRRVRPY
jgi:hypothetical protein